MTYHDEDKPKQFADRQEAKHPVPKGASAVVETGETIRVTTPPEISGMGHRMKRKEDPRFIQGKGRYVDDVKLPDMLYMDIVRSPYAHARILNIDCKRCSGDGRCSRGDHGQGSGSAQTALDADVNVRHTDGAPDR